MAVFAVWALTAQTAWPAMHLALVGEEPVRVLDCLPVETGAIIQLEFVNSIFLTKVRESFTCRPEDGISLVSVESPSQAVFEYYGLLPDGSGRMNLFRPVGEIRLRSHDYENHLLIIGEQTVRLKGLVENGKSLIIKVLTEGCRKSRSD